MSIKQGPNSAPPCGHLYFTLQRPQTVSKSAAKGKKSLSRQTVKTLAQGMEHRLRRQALIPQVSNNQLFFCRQFPNMAGVRVLFLERPLFRGQGIRKGRKGFHIEKELHRYAKYFGNAVQGIGVRRCAAGFVVRIRRTAHAQNRRDFPLGIPRQDTVFAESCGKHARSTQSRVLSVFLSHTAAALPFHPGPTVPACTSLSMPRILFAKSMAVCLGMK